MVVLLGYVKLIPRCHCLKEKTSSIKIEYDFCHTELNINYNNIFTYAIGHLYFGPDLAPKVAKYFGYFCKKKMYRQDVSKIGQSGHTHLKCVIHYSPSHESKQSQRSQLERSAWHTKNVLHQSSVKWNPKIWRGLLSVWCVSEQDLLLGLCYKMICASVEFINRLFAVLGTLSFTTFRLGQICN